MKRTTKQPEIEAPRKVSVGVKLRGARRNAGLNLVKLGLASRVPPSVLSNIECGKTKNPTVRTIARVAGVFGFSISEFLIDVEVDG